MSPDESVHTMQLMQQVSLLPPALLSRARLRTARISTESSLKAAVMFRLYLALTSTWLSFQDFFTLKRLCMKCRNDSLMTYLKIEVQSKD